jgi:2',3'-cyclic-nucleotide 2'-phosphodiesterase (5'-nucleotidase family)
MPILALISTWHEKKNPNTFIIDTGDMFQGSELSVQTTGQAIQPILNALGYNLYIPGNWEVVYYKANIQKLLQTWNIGHHQIQEQLPTNFLCMVNFTKKYCMFMNSMNSKGGWLCSQCNY